MTTDFIQTALKPWLAPLGDDLPELYTVGGAIRDAMLHKSPRDIDLVCRQAAEFARNLGASQSPPAAVIDFSKEKFTPCFRVINRRHPDNFIDILQMNGPDLESDLRQRDFTINAMARPIFPGGRPGDLIDPLKGQKDIQSGRIQACSDQAFINDPLRVIRAARFAAELNFTIDPETLTLMRESASLLSRTAAERVQVELFHILRCPKSAPFIRLLDKTDVLAVIFPEINAMKGCRQNPFHHLDVWEHCLETMKHCELIINRPKTFFQTVAPAVMKTLSGDRRQPLLKLAALFHDIGKPFSSRFSAEKERSVFYGHARAGRDIITGIADRLRLSAADKEFLTRLVVQHMRPPALARPETREKTMIKWFRQLGDDGLAVIILALADMQAKAGPATVPENKERLRLWADLAAATYLGSLKDNLAKENLLSGHDLLAMGMKPGPELGKILAAIREEQDMGSLASREEALKLAVKKILST